MTTAVDTSPRGQALRRVLCWLTRHRPDVFAPVCTRCGDVVSTGPILRSTGIHTPPEGCPVILRQRRQPRRTTP